MFWIRFSIESGYGLDSVFNRIRIFLDSVFNRIRICSGSGFLNPDRRGFCLDPVWFLKSGCGFIFHPDPHKKGSGSVIVINISN